MEKIAGNQDCGTRNPWQGMGTAKTFQVLLWQKLFKKTLKPGQQSDYTKTFAAELVIHLKKNDVKIPL